MHDEVKKYVDSHDIQGLKYIFVDCLDVDPTFEKYREDYQYVKQHGLFEPHKDLTAFTNSQSDWNENYWQKLKKDLLKNFSAERLEHMKTVARVVNADKFERLQKERQINNRPQPSESFTEKPTAEIVTESAPPSFSGKSKAELQQEKLERKRQQLKNENEETERRERQQKESARQRRTPPEPPKKDTGIALKVLMIIIIIVAIIAITR